MGNKYTSNSFSVDPCRTGRNIRRLLAERNIGVKELKEWLNLSSVQSIYHWIEGKSFPTVDNLYAMSELLHVPMDAIIIGNRETRFLYCGIPGYQRAYLYYRKIVANETDLFVKAAG